MHKNTDQSIAEFFSHYTLMHYEKGERILRENESPSGVYLIKEGVVRSYLISEEGNELTIMFNPQDSIFSLRWVLNDLPNIYNYQAMNEVALWRAPREAFLEFLQDNPESLMQVTRQLVEDCNAIIYRMQHIVFGNAYAKVAAVVLTAAKRFGGKMEKGNITVQVPFTHQQIADSAGITRETASLEMKKLRDNGLINYKGRTLIVQDMEKLAEASFL